MFNTKILNAICHRYGFETHNMVEEFLEKDEKALEYVLRILFFEILDLVERKLSDEFEKFVEEYADEYGIPEIDYDEK